ncbi:MAG: shikimate dehydrogenase [Acidimicrobiales bacterium]|jgi:shikimate 5-dehydrogenase
MTTATTGERIFTFIGVTTAKSAIMRIFPAWAEHLGLGNVRMAGCDLGLHAPPEHYRQAVEVIRSGPAELGALVTTHKIDLFAACRDMFDFVDPYAELCGEVSSLSKRDGLFRAHAKDPISSGRALDEFIEPGYWASGGAGGAGGRQGGAGPEVLLFGAGGSNLAITLHLMRGRPDGDRPSRIVVVNRSPARLESMRAVHERLGQQVKVEYVHNADPARNDRLMAEMPPGSLVVNGTGMGKDSPGSPVTDQGVFPEGARVWELNYRGELDFLHQARRQEAGRALLVEDGWRYFVHGWTCVMEEVFEVPMTPAVVGELSSIALGLRST